MTEREQFEAWAKSKGAPKDGWWIRQLDDGGYSCHAADMAWEAWQAALAQPAQAGAEPVAWGVFYFGGKLNGRLYTHCGTGAQADAYIADRHQSDDSNTFRKAPLYTHPPARVPLTDGELRNISKQQDPVVPLHHNVLAFAHAVIAAYEAKNGIGGGK